MECSRKTGGREAAPGPSGPARARQCWERAGGRLRSQRDADWAESETTTTTQPASQQRPRPDDPPPPSPLSASPSSAGSPSPSIRAQSESISRGPRSQLARSLLVASAPPPPSPLRVRTHRDLRQASSPRLVLLGGWTLDRLRMLTLRSPTTTSSSSTSSFLATTPAAHHASLGPRVPRQLTISLCC